MRRERRGGPKKGPTRKNKNQNPPPPFPPPSSGRGSFGVVYKARWYGGLVALKVIPLSPVAVETATAIVGGGPESAPPPAADLSPLSAAVGSRVGRELSLGVALSHPHLVACYRAWLVDAAAVGAHRASWEGSAPRAASSAARAAPPSSSAAAAAAAAAPLPDRSAYADRADSGLAVEAAARAGADGGPACDEGQPPDAGAVAAANAAAAAAASSSPPREAWLLLEYCAGGTLDAAIRAGRFAPPASDAALAAALRTLRDVAAGMDYLHAHGVAHGDLKPCNVLLKPAPRGAGDGRGFIAKVGDFGLSRFVGARGHVSTHTTGKRGERKGGWGVGCGVWGKRESVFVFSSVNVITPPPFPPPPSLSPLRRLHPVHVARGDDGTPRQPGVRRVQASAEKT